MLDATIALLTHCSYFLHGLDLYDGNFYFLAYYFIHNYNNLHNRNPNFGVGQAMGVFGGMRAAYMCYILHRKDRGTFPIRQSTIDSIYRMGPTLGILVLGALRPVHRPIHTRRDRLLLLGILIITAIIIHAVNIWILGCYFLGKDPLSMIVALAEEKGDPPALTVFSIMIFWSGRAIDMVACRPSR